MIPFTTDAHLTPDRHRGAITRTETLALSGDSGDSQVQEQIADTVLTVVLRTGTI